MSKSSWKVPFVDYQLFTEILKKSKDEYTFNLDTKKRNARHLLKTMSRSSTILPGFVGFNVYVYTGKNYRHIRINDRMVGHKLGEFVFTRRFGKIHRKKKSRSTLVKKKKK